MKGEIKHDKLLHFETSALLVILFSRFLPLWLSGSVAILVGIIKEIWDIKHGVFSWKDIVSDLLGVITGVAVLLI